MKTSFGQLTQRLLAKMPSPVREFFLRRTDPSQFLDIVTKRALAQNDVTAQVVEGSTPAGKSDTKFSIYRKPASITLQLSSGLQVSVGTAQLRSHRGVFTVRVLNEANEGPRSIRESQLGGYLKELATSPEIPPMMSSD